MKSRSALRLVFITGSDTGVGKTVLTALLTAHLRLAGAPVFALKPFCSGRRDDARLLRDVQGYRLTLNEINPWYFPDPLAPMIAARKRKQSISPAEIFRHMRAITQKLQRSVSEAAKEFLPQVEVPTLLVEGVGGLLVPLSKQFSVLDLIQRLRSEVLVAAVNRLGTLNHCRLTIEALRAAQVEGVKLVLIDAPSPDASSASNPAVLAELVAPTPVFRLPFLRPKPASAHRILTHALRLRTSLADLLA